jgi:hypothetical protein
MKPVTRRHGDANGSPDCFFDKEEVLEEDGEDWWVMEMGLDNPQHPPLRLGITLYGFSVLYKKNVINHTL